MKTTSISKKEPPSYSGPSHNAPPGVSFVSQNGVHLSQAACGPATPVQGYIPPPQPSSFGPPTNSSPYFINTANTPPYTASLDRSYHTAATRLALLPRKSVLEAYLLAVSPFGILGAHHFYLRRYYWGIVYFFTLGLMGCGYLIDWFRVPFLVKDANEKLQSTDPKVEEKKNLSDAYTLWFPFGLLGFHHYYLGNYAWGAVYTFSGGIFGIGWLIDSIRMPWLVKAANERIMSSPIERNEKNLCPAYALGLTPIGILGGHHYYLNRPLWGVLYTLTLGMVGVGWLFDWIRMPYIVARVNEEVRGKRPPNVKTADDAYILWFVFGFLGFHHFYLGRPLWGLLYFFTLGLFGIGWLVDMCRIPFLVKEVNKENEERRRIIASQIEEANRQTVAHVTVTRGYQNYGMVNPGEYPPPVPQTGLYPNYPVAYNYSQGAAAQSYQTAGYDYFAPGQPPSTVIMAEPQPPPYSPREQEAEPLPEKHVV